MKLTIVRTGAPPAPRRDGFDADEWRQWAYEAATEAGAPRMEFPVQMVVTPEAHDRRGVKRADASYEVVRAVIDGLVSAGVLTDPLDIGELVVKRGRVAGVSRLSVTLTDVAEPF